MKRRVSYILVITLMATALLACDKDSKVEESAITEEMEEPAAETVESADSEEVSMSDFDPEFAYTAVKYESDSDYFSGKIQCVEITDNGHEALATAVNEYFSDAIENFNKSCEAYLKEVKEVNDKLAQDKEENEGAENEFVYDYTAYYDYDIYCEVVRCDNQMLSIKVDEYTYTGGAHGGTVEYGVTFDTVTGEILTNASFDEFKDVVKAEILNDIASSSEDAKGTLFPEYEDTINDLLDQGLSTVGLVFDDRGMIVNFDQYAIAPYAMGIISFSIPYEKLDGFDEKYIPDGSFYTVDIPSSGLAARIDVDGDGAENVVYLETIYDDENGTSEIRIHIDDVVIDRDDGDTFYCEALFVHSSTGNYLVLDCVGASDCHTTYLYDVDKNYRLIESIDGSITQISDGECTIQYKVDAFGSWGAKKNYTYDGNGFSTTETVDNLDNLPSKGDDAIGITLLKRLKYIDGNEEEQILEKGTVIYPITLDGNKLEFMTEDGSVSGYFTFEYTDGERYVDGVNEYDLFDDMPYAS